MPDGFFYTQGSSATSPLAGYSVTGALWDAFNQEGGTDSVGYPVSRQWTDSDGRINQAFERALLQVTVAADGTANVQRANVLDLLSLEGLDGWLEQEYFIPPIADNPLAGEGTSELTPRARAALDGDPLIRKYFLSTHDWQDRFGLPVVLERYDEDVVTLRAQRAALRHWLVDSPRAARGTIEVIDAGALAKAGLLAPAESARPEVSPRYGWLRVSGRQIVDSAGQPVRIAGVSWSGLELRRFAPSGLAIRDYREIVDRIAALGFNTIRLPFSNEMVERDPIPLDQDVAACPDCQNKTALEIMDLIVDYAGEKGLRIILDNHFSAASDQQGSELWYTDQYPDAIWVKDWQVLAERYRHTPAVAGFDLRNEPHGRTTWGSGDHRSDWRLAAERAGRAILDVNPEALIIVEGIEHFPKVDGSPDPAWWGANLRGVRSFPVRLPAANLLYSAHDYGPTLYPQRWFSDKTTAQSLREVWSHYWAYLNLEQDRPLLIGELGTGNTPEDFSGTKAGSQGQWFQAIAALVAERDNLHWVYWAISAEDPFSLLDSQYKEVADTRKLAILQPALGKQFAALPAIVQRERGGIAGVARDRAS